MAHSSLSANPQPPLDNLQQAWHQLSNNLLLIQVLQIHVDYLDHWRALRGSDARLVELFLCIGRVELQRNVIEIGWFIAAERLQQTNDQINEIGLDQGRGRMLSQVSYGQN